MSNFCKYKFRQPDGTNTFGSINLDHVCDFNKVIVRNNEGTPLVGLVLNFPFPIDKTQTFGLEYHKGGEVKRTQTKIIRVPYSVVVEDAEDIINILSLLGIEDSIPTRDNPVILPGNDAQVPLDLPDYPEIEQSTSGE